MRERIKDYLGCDEKRAAYTEEKLSQIDERLKPILDRWLKDGTESSDDIFHGYSINLLMRRYRMKFTGAILTLDWIVKDPVCAQEALKYGIR